MIKAVIRDKDGSKTLYVGLSFGNLDKFRADPLDSYIRIEGSELDLPIDLMIFSGKTEAEMLEFMQGGLGPETKFTISKRSKN